LQRVKDFEELTKWLTRGSAVRYWLDLRGLAMSKHMMLHLRSGTRFLCRSGTNDRAIIREIWTLDPYLIKKVVLRGQANIIDLGANIGGFSVLAAVTHPNAVIYSYEPLPESYGLLVRNAAINGCLNIRAYNLAVSGVPGDSLLCYSANRPGDSALLGESMDSGRARVKVRCVTFEQIITENKIDVIDFLKIDIEGSEYNVLESLRPQLLSRVSYFAAECHRRPGGSVRQLTLQLERAGFVVDFSPASASAGMNNVGMLYARKRETSS